MEILGLSLWNICQIKITFRDFFFYKSLSGVPFMKFALLSGCPPVQSKLCSFHLQIRGNRTMHTVEAREIFPKFHFNFRDYPQFLDVSRDDCKKRFRLQVSIPLFQTAWTFLRCEEDVSPELPQSPHPALCGVLFLPFNAKSAHLLNPLKSWSGSCDHGLHRTFWGLSTHLLDVSLQITFWEGSIMDLTFSQSTANAFTMTSPSVYFGLLCLLCSSNPFPAKYSACFSSPNPKTRRGAACIAAAPVSQDLLWTCFDNFD